MTTVYTQMTHATTLPSTAPNRALPAQRVETFTPQLRWCVLASPAATLGTACCYLVR